MYDGSVIRQQPDWRSQEFNELVDKLGSRADASIKNARKTRILKSPKKIPPPKNCMPWIVTN